MIIIVKLINIAISHISIFLFFSENTWNLLSKQISSVQYGIVNYSHHAID